MREFIKFIAKILAQILYRVKIIGRENIPKNSGAIICPNHVHAMDGPVTIAFIKRKIHVLTKEEFFTNSFTKWFAKTCLLHPIKRDSADIQAIKLSLTLLKDSQLLMIFPEGTRNRNGKRYKTEKWSNNNCNEGTVFQ